MAKNIGLSAPAALVVEVVAPEGRVFRLSRQIGEGGLDLALPVPYEPGSPVRVQFRVPGNPELHAATCEVVALQIDSEQEGERGGAGLRFLSAPRTVELAVMAYVVRRLRLPALDLDRWGPRTAP